ncbi:MAG: ATP-binding protein [Deltaproteobacteria bacterium]|nr:ATP-binding protein [Deltaproteobacteria bacterium]MDZ4345665.1 ATP-binding protein [Candidatus Binatia bacterium]
MVSAIDFRLTWLWRHAFLNPQADITTAEQEYFRDRYLSMREKAGILVSRIAVDMPELTVHDLTHLDALWETASIVAEGAITLNPPEAFVFGAAVLLHDAAMSLAAFPQGLIDVKKTIVWKDTIARLTNSESEVISFENPPVEISKRAVPEVLRRLHAEHAAVLAEQAWTMANGDQVYLIDDSELRYFYSTTIGQIAHSHWWPVTRIEQELPEDLGAFPQRTRCKVDRIKIACLLRTADALHLDQRRAPRFLRGFVNPTGLPALHWGFQEKLAAPHVELDSIVFTAGAPFDLASADAWWLAYDTISAVDRELREVDLLLQNRGRGLLKARRVKGAGTPESLARTIQTRGWRPVDTQLKVSDIPKVIEALGGEKLYGKDLTVALREMIQNSVDAIQARRRIHQRPDSWGLITVSLIEREGEHWLVIEDTGTGMSEHVLTGPLIDFGSSFWRSPLAAEEFPGLLATGMAPIGRFGIGFFSVFMLGSVVRVISRRYDRGEETTRILEFRDGTASRPILYSATQDAGPLDGGTRIEVRLNIDPRDSKGLLGTVLGGGRALKLSQLVGALAPNVDVAITTNEETERGAAVTKPKDWIDLPDSVLMQRLNPSSETAPSAKKTRSKSLIRRLQDSKRRIYGRASIHPSSYFVGSDRGWVTVGGLRAARLSNVRGLLVGEPLTASRDSALPTVPLDVLAAWATEQAKLISASNASDEHKATCAEIVIECGGNPCSLPIAQWGGEWLDETTLKERFVDINELVVNFDGDFRYDEDIDSVHPREFRDYFKLSSDIMIVPKHEGSILTVGQQRWPAMITGRVKSYDSNLSLVVRRILADAWGPSIEHGTEERDVGNVRDDAITRDVEVFSRE